MASSKDPALFWRRKKSITPPPSMSGLRIVLLGKNLQHTNKIGNFILEKAAFESEALTHSVKCASGHVQGTYITIINAAPLFKPSLKPEELEECVRLSAPGPHAFLLVLQPHIFTEEDKNQFVSLLNNFSAQALNYAFVIGITQESRKQSNAFQTLIKECCQRYRKYKQLQKNKSSCHQLFAEIKNVVKENGGNYVICESAKNVNKESFQTDENLKRHVERTTPDVSDETEEKSKVSSMGNILGKIGLSSLLPEQKTGESHFKMSGSDSTLPELNLMLCGSDEALKTSISKIILGPRKIKTGLVDNYIVRLVETAALYNTSLSDEELMNKILRCFSCDNPVHAFLLLIPVGPLTDDDKGEIETIQRTFGSRVFDHSVVIFTRVFTLST